MMKGPRCPDSPQTGHTDIRGACVRERGGEVSIAASSAQEVARSTAALKVKYDELLRGAATGAARGGAGWAHHKAATASWLPLVLL
ncbi:hypothetical protein FQN60_002960 [Etheostoma spectabile]|uniref:Uncharacterized protein n=1 Tax=Etheostoma spectabile TaxID=54343 RepID=A0A5J5CL02_9PERO|nr:hypothetical protein FQN60_002960 [Etheostoma spectabile]